MRWLVCVGLMGCAVAQDPPMVPPDVATFRATGEVRFQVVEVRCDDGCDVRSGRHPNAEASAYAMFVFAGVLVLIPFAVGRRFGYARSLIGPTACCVVFALGMIVWAGAKLWVVREATLDDRELRVHLETLWSVADETTPLEGAKVRLGYVRTGSRGSPKRIHFLQVADTTILQAYGTDDDEPAYRAFRDALAERLGLEVDPEVDWAYLDW